VVERSTTSTGVASAVSSPERRRRDARGQLTEIGSTIRGLRGEQDLSLRDLGRATGFSISFLSLLERGRSSLSLTSLHAIGAGFSGPDQSPLAGSWMRAASSVRSNPLVTIEPDEEARPRDDCAQEGEEFAYVLSGELVFTMDDVEHTLEAGDCIHYRSTVPHVVRNGSDRPAEVLWVLTPTPC
jgi:transcriptional regulator with XRE-family HTH domain